MNNELINQIENNSKIYMKKEDLNNITNIILNHFNDKKVILFTNESIEIKNDKLMIFDNRYIMTTIKTLSLDPKNNDIANNEIIIMDFDTNRNIFNIIRMLHDYPSKIIYLDKYNRSDKGINEINDYVDLVIK